MTFDSIYQMGYIFLFLFIAKLIKVKVPFIRGIVIPTPLLAGFIGLVLGQELLGIFHYDQSFYEALVFHCLGIGFIALTLSEKRSIPRQDSTMSGLFIIASYCFQGVVGMLVLTVLMATLLPDVFFGLGLMLPLAYGQGPGFASAIGSSWDETLHIGYGNQYGLTLATVGFLVGGVIGVIMLNFLLKVKKMPIDKSTYREGVQFKDIRLSSVRELNFFDNITTQVVWIGILYMLALWVMEGVAMLLSHGGTMGNTIAGLVMGFNYLFGILMSMGFKGIMYWLNKKGHRTKELTDTYVMQNISSLAFHIMICASVLAISIHAISEYALILAAVSIVGAVATLIFVILLGKIAFKRHPWYYILAMFGMMTGTASTGLALLRGVDPDLQTDVASNLVLGSAIAAPLGIPLMALLGLPAMSYVNGTTSYYYIAFIGIFMYLIGIIAVIVWRQRQWNKT